MSALVEDHPINELILKPEETQTETLLESQTAEPQAATKDDQEEGPIASELPNEEPREPEAEAPVQPTSNRLVSLDAFRGLTVLGMLLVNNVALNTQTPKQMLHADWSGEVSLADLVFPWFLLIVGVAIPYAAASRQAHGEAFWRFVPKVFGRAFTLVLIGCLIDSSAAHRPLFDLNVLQLIGLAYLVAALLYPLSLSARALLAMLLLGVHWYVLKFVPQPGAAAGTFTPDQNAVAYLNQAYFQRYHLNGLFSVLPAAAMILIGTALGNILRRESLRPWRRALAVWCLGVFLVALGWLVSLDLPFNKPVWTSSFILFTAGCGALALGCFYSVLDIKQWRWGALPLLVLGSNPIFAYVAPILIKIYILQGWTWTENGKEWPLQTALLHASVAHWGRVEGGLVYTACYVLFWWLMLFAMYRKRIFLRV